MSAQGRSAAVFIAVGAFALAVGVTAGGGAPPVAAALLWVFFVAVVAGAWRSAFVPCVALTETGVVIQNRVLRTAVPYGEIAAVRPGYSGLTIVRRAGGPVTA